MIRITGSRTQRVGLDAVRVPGSFQWTSSRLKVQRLDRVDPQIFGPGVQDHDLMRVLDPVVSHVMRRGDVWKPTPIRIEADPRTSGLVPGKQPVERWLPRRTVHPDIRPCRVGEAPSGYEADRERPSRRYHRDGIIPRSECRRRIRHVAGALNDNGPVVSCGWSRRGRRCGNRRCSRC